MNKRIFLTLCAVVLAVFIYAVPAYRGVRAVTLADGTSVQVTMNGDEFCHYLLTADGQIVNKNADGTYSLAVDNAAAMQKMQARRNTQIQKRPIGALNLAPRGLVILANYTNKTYSSANTNAQMDSMMNAANYTYNGATGSARKYFTDQSSGSYVPNFDVVGPVTLPKNMAYYGANDSYGNDVLPGDLVVHACSLAYAQYNVDFSLYDNDNDGEVDFVYILYAGYGEADSYDENTIWPHNWNLESAIYYDNTTITSLPTYNGKKINNYACSSELDGQSGSRAGIGTICHEFSHVLGLPDLYATVEDATHKTMGEWDILDYGPYNNDGKTPPAYSAYERFFMGWLTPQVLNAAGHFSLAEIQSSNAAYLVSSTGAHNMSGTSPNPTTFYLMENRQQTGWDTYLPGHGMLVTKITYSSSKWSENTVNNTSSSMGVDIIEADGSAPAYSTSNYNNGYFGKQGDAFPTTSVTSFTPYTNYPLTAIAENSAVISFDFMGGVARAYTVTFNAGEYGTCATATLTESAVGAGVVLPQVTTTAADITFQGWSTSAAARTADAGAANATYHPTADQTLYAVYYQNGTPMQGECIEETFAQCTANVSTDIASSLDTYCDLSGWTGQKVYCYSGALKLGSSKSTGYIVTPALGLTGTVALTFDARNYSSESSTLTLTISGGGTLSESTVSLSESMATYTVTITNCTADTKVKFQNSINRFYFDEMQSCTVSATSVEVPQTENIKLISIAQGFRLEQLPENASVHVFSAQGQLMQSSTANGTYSISLPQGMYLVRITSAAGRTEVLKAIVH